MAFSLPERWTLKWKLWLACSDIVFVCSKFLYPKRDFANDAMSDDGDGLQAGNHDGKYELFAEVDNTVREEIKDLVFNGE